MTAKKFIIGFIVALTAAAVVNIAPGCNGNTKGKSNADSTSASGKDDNTILGAGSTFVYPLFSRQFSEYNKLTGLKVNYQSIGSGGGILQLINKTVDFGDSDSPLNEDQSKKIGAPVLHIPMCAGAVVISYNLPGISDTLLLTPEVIAGIYLGKIKKWSDPQIAAINKGVKLPDFPVLVIHRADGSGTTGIFTNYLSKINSEWKNKVGEGTAVNWPVGLGGKGNEGVSAAIKQTPGGIGYIELAYAIQNKMIYAKVENKMGKFIAPAITSTSAAAEIQLPEDSKIFITDTNAIDGYPIAGFTWALIYQEQNYNRRSFQKAQNVLKLLWWNIHDGQQYCAGLNYAPLSPAAIKVAEKILLSATYDGKQILKQY
ncbi:MAG: phosphate ABC transporter substrate-binding protein PstS [Sphingobacteriales bacterium UTBCD1]|jgi:phosphate transport system substrate-binding protein|nr:MAG: phosphate ABC transporter substrate-binding protein PstS [Sphingobacteriales bacterium UTBCD1]